ncbi:MULTISPECIES: UBP-type zinc finger domain-containing protein [unclassified Streptomyces]|uniref:UBP-type zinc finger domain-containing protein n=1 Tax=unclassified Streptomyces TaxID=2593676 RepID=UPI00342AB5A8
MDRQVVTCPVRAVTTDSDWHLSMVRPVTPRTPDGCEECLRLGAPWERLRLCLTCGHVGCCDSSPLRHARAHAASLGHPLVASLEPGEDWRWCYMHEAFV